MQFPKNIPCQAIMESLADGVFTVDTDWTVTYFNRAAGAGVRLDYDPACVKNPQFWWRPQYRQANLELYSQEQELKPGESLSMAYRLRFLDGPPAD